MHIKLDSLLVAVKEDVQEYLKYEKFGIFSGLRWTPENSIDENYCSWWRNFINVLVSLPYPTNYHYELVHEFKKHGYEDKIFEEFQSCFPSEKRAIWWYSRSSYFFEILNKALRQRNVRVLLLFGSFLQDLHRQLKSEHLKQMERYENSTIMVYRGQVLFSDEFKKLQVGFPVRSNSFFSSSTDRSLSLGFLVLSSSSIDLERVLFEIEIDYRTVCGPFADISQLSFYSEEQETLFMTNTRFLLESYHQEELNVVDGPPVRYWLVKLKLLSDYDSHSVRELEVTDAARKTVKNCVDTLSEILEMVSTEDVQLVFDALAIFYPTETNWIGVGKLYCLAMLEFENNDNDYKMVVSYHEQAIAIWQKYYLNDVELNCYFNIAESHFALGELFGYSVMDQNDLSVYHWDQALHFYELALPRCTTVATDYARTSILYKLVRVCSNLLRSADRERYGSKAITYQKEWTEHMLLQQSIVWSSRQIATQFKKLADIYAAINQYDDALSNYEKAVNLHLSKDMDETEDWTSSYDLIDLYKNIIKICIEHTRNSDLVLKYQLLQDEYELKISKKDAATGATLCDGNARYQTESQFSMADCNINREGRTAIRCDDRYFPVPLAPDDNRLKDCEFKIEPKEEKLTGESS